MLVDFRVVLRFSEGVGFGDCNGYVSARVTSIFERVLGTRLRL